MGNFGKICSICKNIDFACVSCYLKKEDGIPVHFHCIDLAGLPIADLVSYVNNVPNTPVETLIDEPEEESEEDTD